jgi:hypothetical protein
MDFRRPRERSGLVLRLRQSLAGDLLSSGLSVICRLRIGHLLVAVPTSLGVHEHSCHLPGALQSLSDLAENGVRQRSPLAVSLDALGWCEQIRQATVQYEASNGEAVSASVISPSLHAPQSLFPAAPFCAGTAWRAEPPDKINSVGMALFIQVTVHQLRLAGCVNVGMATPFPASICVPSSHGGAVQPVRTYKA